MTDPASIATARTDARDWLVEAEEPLASLQRRAGGHLPGAIVAPALLDLVRRARNHGFKLARRIEARDGKERVSAWVEVQPGQEGGGCLVRVSDWQIRPLPHDRDQRDIARRASIARDIADLIVRLGPHQEVLAVTSHAPDTAVLADNMEADMGRHWTEFVLPADDDDFPSLDWRILDGVRLRVPGSSRKWTARLYPLGRTAPGSAGFELALVADESLPMTDNRAPDASMQSQAGLGREIAPALRQPVARIIANAETIHAQLAGPLAAQYANYAADIASAGEHLLTLIDDLADLEAVEEEGFSTAAEPIDLAELARRAAAILAVRARQKGIAIETPPKDESVSATGDARRVLQILLNLLGNAIRYSPAQSGICLHAGYRDGRACVAVTDEGEGLSEDDQARIFNKFERLGRNGDGGSGLGLYISRRLAGAMGGELEVESAKGHGARFVLKLPIGTDGL